MKNNKGVSLIEIVFSVAIIVLVLTGVAILIVNVTSVKRKNDERQIAVSLSQKLVENKILELKNADNSLNFWLNNKTNQSEAGYLGYPGYKYTIEYKNPNDKTINCADAQAACQESCLFIFTIKWASLNPPDTLSVERLFTRSGL
jgi:Tfp pilus assembly protein PilV